MSRMHWLAKQLVVLMGACYVAAVEQAIASLPYDVLDAI
jgi:hypothetical protein